MASPYQAFGDDRDPSKSPHRSPYLSAVISPHDPQRHRNPLCSPDATPYPAPTVFPAAPNAWRLFDPAEAMSPSAYQYMQSWRNLIASSLGMFSSSYNLQIIR
jgi:hypothetical protein